MTNTLKITLALLLTLLFAMPVLAETRPLDETVHDLRQVVRDLDERRSDHYAASEGEQHRRALAAHRAAELLRGLLADYRAMLTAAPPADDAHKPLPDPDEPAPDDWQAAFDARDFGAIDAWYAAHTGPRVDELEPSGSVRTTHDGQVISRLDITGRVIIRHKDVVIRDCRITLDGLYAVSYSRGTDARDATLEYCEIIGNESEHIGVYLTGPATIRHNEIRGFRTGGRVHSGHVWDGNWIHSLHYFGDAHNTCLTTRGGEDMVLRRNNLNGGTSAALSLYAAGGPIRDVLVEQNIMRPDRALYTIQGGAHESKGFDSRGVRIIGNLLQAGPSGVRASWDDAGNVWRDNVETEHVE